MKGPALGSMVLGDHVGSLGQYRQNHIKKECLREYGIFSMRSTSADSRVKAVFTG